MNPKSIISLHGEDREEISSSVLHSIWKERWHTCQSCFGSDLPGPYFQYPSHRNHDTDISNFFPNLTVVNPQRRNWKLQDSYASENESVFDGLWKGNAMTVQRSAAAETITESSNCDAMVLHRKGVVQIVRPTERDTSLVCRWDGSIEESVVDSIRALSEACDFTESIDLYISLLAADKLHHPQRLLELIRDDFGTSVSLPLFLFVSSDNPSGQGISNNSTAVNSIFSEIARASALQSIFAECTDTASLLLPMHVPAQFNLLSQALDTALSFRLPQRANLNPELSGSGTSALRTSEWAKRSTVDGYLPVVFLEGGSSLSSMFSKESMFTSLQHLSASPLAPHKGFLSNPFLSSFAPHLSTILQRNDSLINQRSGHNVVGGDDDSDSMDDKDDTSASMEYDLSSSRRYARPLSNFISLRIGAGDNTIDQVISEEEASCISQELFLSCLQSPYMVSGVSIAAGLPASIVPPPRKTMSNTIQKVHAGTAGAEEYRQRMRERLEESDADYASDIRYNQSSLHNAYVDSSIRDIRMNNNSGNNHAQNQYCSEVIGDKSAEFMICGSAVTASRGIGHYLSAQRRHWRHSLQSSSSSFALRLRVLDMLQYEADDIDRVSDSLLNLSERYLSH